MQPQEVFDHIVLAQFLELLDREGRLQELRKNAAFLEQMHRIDSINSENIEDIFDYFYGEYYDEVLAATMEIIHGQVTTNIPCEHSRDYETKSVAAMSPYGKWIGWTVFSGGGKHGDSDSVTLDNLKCYHLDCTYETKTVQIVTFKLPEENIKEENSGTEN